MYFGDGSDVTTMVVSLRLVQYARTCAKPADHNSSGTPHKTGCTKHVCSGLLWLAS